MFQLLRFNINTLITIHLGGHQVLFYTFRFISSNMV